MLTLVLAPLPVTRCFVVYPCQETKLIKRYLISLDTKLMVEFPLRSSPDAIDCRVELCTCFAGYAQGVRTAGIRPHV